MKRLWIILLLALVAAGAGYWWTHRGSSSANTYLTDKVTRGDVQEVIRATGTLEPVDSVDVGAQVAGQIMYFGPDRRDPNFDADEKDPKNTPSNMTVNFRSEVKKGDLLAVIDPTIYQAALEQANATYASANANLEVAMANLESDKAKLTEAENDWNRAQTLGAGEALAQTTYDSYQATYLTAKAQVDQGQAAITQAKASISQAQASVDTAKRNLAYCTITSPVDGSIIDRRVNIGQTVVSSLNTPSLFLIGTDMSKMQIWVSVNEYDTPRLHEGMPVLFEVDGVNRTFQGTVGLVRWNATMTQNVVTYTVEVDCDNPDKLLIPYRTANVKFLVNEQKDTLLVPNAALNWHPRNANNNASAADQGTGSGSGAAAASGSASGTGAPAEASGSGSGRRGARGNRSGGSGNSPAKDGTVYVLDNGQPRAVQVQLGINDEVVTAITGGELKEGDEIITGIATPEDSSNAGTTNPFAPSFFRNGRGGGGGGGGGGGRGGAGG